MSKIAIVSVNSFGRDYPEFLTELEEKVGPVKKFVFESGVTGKEVAEALNGYDYVILGTKPRFDKEFFDNNKTVKLIARHGLGYNNVDIEAAKEAGVYVTKEPGMAERDAVAEWAVSLLMTVSKNIIQGDSNTRNDKWTSGRDSLMGFQLYQKTTGVIGYGNIGHRFGDIMKYGFENRILAYDPFMSEEQIKAAGAEKVDLDTLLEQSDFISIHCALVDSTRNMIGEEQFKKMKKNAIFINTARGELVDEKALINALKQKEIWGYGADVSLKEPMNADNELLTLPHVAITPHIAVYNYTCTKNMNRKVMNDIYLMEEGKKPEEIINGL